MKFQKIFLAVLFSSFCSISFAQYNTLSELYVGPSAGVTMSTITLVPKLVDKMFIDGKTAGISARYVSENHFGFQIELNYFEAGWKEDYYGLKKSSDYSYLRKLNFIEVPFLMHAYTGTKISRVFINVGPKFSYLYSESEILRDQTEESGMLQHGKSVETPFQYGIIGGAGIEFHLKRSVLGLEGRYCYMLSNLFNDTVDPDNFSASNLQTISVNLYYYFQLSKKK